MASSRSLHNLRNRLLEANWYAVPPESLFPRCKPCQEETLRVSLSLPEGRQEDATACFLNHAATTLALVEIAPAENASRENLYQRFLDFSHKERLLLWGLTRQLPIKMLLILENERATLIETDTEILLESGLSLDEIVPRLEHWIGQPPSTEKTGLGTELEQWIDLMAGQIGPPLKWARPDSGRLMRQALLGYKVMLNKPDGPTYLGLRTLDEPRLRTIRWQVARPDNCLAPLLEAAAAHAPEGAGAFGPLERKALNRQMADTGTLDARAMQALMQLSASKLRAEVFLQALVEHGNEHAAWKLALTDPIMVEDILEHDNLYVFQPITIDLASSGVGRIWEAIEKLTAYALAIDKKMAHSGGHQLDFLQKSIEGLSTSGRLEDPFAWLCRHALRIKLDAKHDQEIIAYLVACFIADLQTREPFNKIRPKALRCLPSLFR